MVEPIYTYAYTYEYIGDQYEIVLLFVLILLTKIDTVAINNVAVAANLVLLRVWLAITIHKYGYEDFNMTAADMYMICMQHQSDHNKFYSSRPSDMLGFLNGFLHYSRVQ